MENYEIFQLLGKGGFGLVHLGRDKRSKRLVAIKFVDKAEAIKKRQTKLLLNEAKLQKAVNSRFVIELLNAFTTYRDYVFILELGDIDLHQFIYNYENHFCYDLNVIFVHVLRGIEEIHSRNIIHRDLKPRNILISHGYVKIADFGLATYIRNGRNESAGSYGYRAPEIINKKVYGKKVDFFAIGCILYELLTKKPAFVGKTMRECEENCLFGQIYPDSMLTLEEFKLIQHLCAKDPKDRLCDVQVIASKILPANIKYEELFNYKIISYIPSPIPKETDQTDHEFNNIFLAKEEFE